MPNIIIHLLFGQFYEPDAILFNGVNTFITYSFLNNVQVTIAINVCTHHSPSVMPTILCRALQFFDSYMEPNITISSIFKSIQDYNCVYIKDAYSQPALIPASYIYWMKSFDIQQSQLSMFLCIPTSILYGSTIIVMKAMLYLHPRWPSN